MPARFWPEPMGKKKGAFFKAPFLMVQAELISKYHSKLSNGLFTEMPGLFKTCV